jgi:hypothetical protein
MNINILEEKMKRIITLVFLLFTILSLTSCKLKDDPFNSVVSEDFIYSKVGVVGENNVAIIGLSEEGKSKETLVFPAMIDGYNVVKIGTYFVKKPSGKLIINKAKNVYFTSNINHVKTEIEYDYDSNVEELNVFKPFNEFGTSPDFYGGVTDKKNHKIFISKSYYDEVYQQSLDYNYVPANVEYYIGENDLFFLDDANGTVVNVVPPTPYKEGYEFKGWYKDLEYNIPWDFDNDIIPQKVYDEEGNYLFIETKLYAKWDAK